MTPPTSPLPLKYPGGKRSYLPAILSALGPLDEIERYMEPFVGGGAVAMGLRSVGWKGRMYLSDLNPGTAAVWRALAAGGDEVEGVIRAVEAFLASYKGLESAEQEAAYYRLRSDTELHPAARMILLNRLGFNGLVRVNQKGEVNVPWGKSTPRFDPDLLRQASDLLRTGPVLAIGGSYGILLSHAGRGDAVLLDPPYLGGFVAYTASGWTEAAHVRLVQMAAEAVDRGAKVVVTDSGVEGVRERWADAGFDVGDLEERRTINSDGDGRGTVGCTLAVGTPTSTRRTSRGQEPQDGRAADADLQRDRRDPARRLGAGDPAHDGDRQEPRRGGATDCGGTTHGGGAAGVDPVSRIYVGDCVEVMASGAAGSVGGIVTDPPYGLEFMGQEWDKLDTPTLDWQNKGAITKVGLGGGRPNPLPSYNAPGIAGTANATCATCGGRMRGKKKCGCAEPDWRVKGRKIAGEEEEGEAGEIAASEWGRGIGRAGKAWLTGASLTPGGSARFENSPALPSFASTSSENRLCRSCGGSERGKDRKGFTRCRCEEPDFPDRVQTPGLAGNLMQASHVRWLHEAARVLAPGAPLFSFSGSRTQHRLAAAIAEAFGENCPIGINGWTYASGFPKSLSVSKALDKAAGVRGAVVGVDPARAGRLVNQGGDYTTAAGWSAGHRTADIIAPTSPEAVRWSGWGTALRPSYEPILTVNVPPSPLIRLVYLLRKPLGAGTVVGNVLKYGTGAINVEANRVPRGGEGLNGGAYSGELREKAGGWQSADRSGGQGSGFRPGTGDFVQPSGGWPGNLLLVHLSGCKQEGTRQVNGTGHWPASRPKNETHGGPDGHAGQTGLVEKTAREEVPAWTCAEGCAVALWGRLNGPKKSGPAGTKRKSAKGGADYATIGKESRAEGTTWASFGDEGGVSRFWHQFPSIEGAAFHLHALIDPSMVDSTAFVPYTTFDAIPEGEVNAGYAGLLLNGPHSQEEAAALARSALTALLPGAHVWLFAPVEQPTGWVAACAFEDAGFEIRDCVMIFGGEVPGDATVDDLPVFYSGKAPVRERWGLRSCATCGFEEALPAKKLRDERKTATCPRCTGGSDEPR